MIDGKSGMVNVNIIIAIIQPLLWFSIITVYTIILIKVIRSSSEWRTQNQHIAIVWGLGDAVRSWRRKETPCSVCCMELTKPCFVSIRLQTFSCTCESTAHLGNGLQCCVVGERQQNNSDHNHSSKSRKNDIDNSSSKAKSFSTRSISSSRCYNCFNNKKEINSHDSKTNEKMQWLKSNAENSKTSTNFYSCTAKENTANRNQFKNSTHIQQPGFNKFKRTQTRTITTSAKNQQQNWISTLPRTRTLGPTRD